MSEMRIEVGRFYKTRGGKVVKILGYFPDDLVSNSPYIGTFVDPPIFGGVGKYAYMWSENGGWDGIDGEKSTDEHNLVEALPTDAAKED
jgi:hypothetical protein